MICDGWGGVCASVMFVFIGILLKFVDSSLKLFMEIFQPHLTSVQPPIFISTLPISNSFVLKSKIDLFSQASQNQKSISHAASVDLEELQQVLHVPKRIPTDEQFLLGLAVYGQFKGSRVLK